MVNFWSQFACKLQVEGLKINLHLNDTCLETFFPFIQMIYHKHDEHMPHEKPWTKKVRVKVPLISSWMNETTHSCLWRKENLTNIHMIEMIIFHAWKIGLKFWRRLKSELLSCFILKIHEQNILNIHLHLLLRKVISFKIKLYFSILCWNKSLNCL